jgi:SAM-dependent methyltransferase
MRNSLIDILICPHCLPDQNRLTEKRVSMDGDDIIEGELCCQKCGRRYPILDGIAFLEPGRSEYAMRENRYEKESVVSSYLWSHYADLLNDDEASDAYARWADLIDGISPGLFLDIGASVGRFSFEMSKKSDFVIGIDNSVAFIRTARQLMKHHQKTITLLEEGLLLREETIRFPRDWHNGNVEFIVGDAQALPFRSDAFSALSSLNLVDKIPFPIKHLTEMNRVARQHGAQFVFSDPFSWSQDVAEEKNWLGGRNNGTFSGRGMDNVIALLKGQEGILRPPWEIEDQGHIWWKIRTHRNHFELIRSCFVKAHR